MDIKKVAPIIFNDMIKIKSGMNIIYISRNYINNINLYENGTWYCITINNIKIIQKIMYSNSFNDIEKMIDKLVQDLASGITEIIVE